MICSMVMILNYIDSKWDGDTAKFLCANGLTTEEIEAIKAKCIAG